MLRQSMQPLINYFREAGNAPHDDMFDGITYWTDLQLQNILDRHAYLIGVLYKHVSGNVYVAHDSFRHYLLNPDSTDVDLSGFDMITKQITSDTPVYKIMGLWTNMNDALADLWLQKAGHREKYVNFKAGSNQVSVSQSYDHCIKMYHIYRNRRIRRYDR